MLLFVAGLLEQSRAGGGERGTVWQPRWFGQNRCRRHRHRCRSLVRFLAQRDGERVAADQRGRSDQTRKEQLQ